MPLISVVMSVYNAQHYLDQAVRSILAQTQGDFEYIAVDDGSTDSSLRMLRQWERKDSRLKVLGCAHRGIVPTVNEGLAMAKSEFIARMDADDVAMPNRFALQIERMRQDEEVVLIGGAYDLIDSAGRLLRRMYPPLDNETIQKQMLAGTPPINQPLAMLRKSALDKVGFYNPEFEASEDLDLFLRMGEVGKVVCLPQILQQYRIHSSSISEQKQMTQLEGMRLACERAWARRGIQGKFLGEKPWRPVAGVISTHEFMLRYGWWAFNSGERRTAAIYGVKAVLQRPYKVSGWRLLACAAMKRSPEGESDADALAWPQCFSPEQPKSAVPAPLWPRTFT
ncbi:MAG TPA: glycosyltransferase family 2 protein [Tepidisphaeraceae bacterium]|jgi:glycosyltransferase involved in cell wall biosynthesis